MVITDTGFDGSVVEGYLESFTLIHSFHAFHRKTAIHVSSYSQMSIDMYI